MSDANLEQARMANNQIAVATRELTAATTASDEETTLDCINWKSNPTSDCCNLQVFLFTSL